MKKDLIKGFKLMRYALSMKMNILCMLLFFVLGFAVDMVECIGLKGGDSLEGQISIGAILMLCAGMFPAQLVISLDVGTMVEASPYKKKLQTSMPSVYNGVFMGAFYLVLVLIRVIAWSIHGDDTVFQSLLSVGIMASVLLIYTMFVYKFFLLSIILLYIAMFGFGLVTGVDARMGNSGILASLKTALSPVPAVLVSLGLIIVSAFIHYFITRVFYKRPLSRYAFGAALRRSSM